MPTMDAERIAENTRGVPEVRITVANSRLWPRLDEVWRFRDLLYLLAWRDIRLRYKQTAIGVAGGFRWALLGTERPLGGLLALSTLTVLGGLAVATAFFVRTERTMADEI